MGTLQELPINSCHRGGLEFCSNTLEAANVFPATDPELTQGDTDLAIALLFKVTNQK